MTVTDVSSGLLSQEENGRLVGLIQQSHRKNQALAIAVVKLYLSDPNEKHRDWMERVAGTAIFTKDYGRKSYYIQIFDMEYFQQVWEQELYMEMEYKAPQTWFHSFEADHNMVGLSFADEREGQNFQGLVQGKIEQRRVKQQQQLSPGPNSGPKQISASPRMQKKPTPEVTETSKSKKKKQKSKKGISKLDISGPDTSSFVHVTGVRSDGVGGMRYVDNSHMIDPVLKKYLTIAGIDPSSLGAQEIEQVKKFAEKENLYEQVEQRKTVRRAEKRQSKLPGAPPPPPGQRPPPRPAPLPSIKEQSKGTPPIPGRAPTRPAKPPPNLPNCPPPRKKPSKTVKTAGNMPPPPPLGGGPPPPPPPPGPGLSSPPTMTSTPKLPTNPKPNRGDLNGQIQNFSGGLKKPPPNNPPPASGRGDLMSQIRGGAKLRPVTDDDINDRNSSSVEEGGLMGALKGALANIHEATGFSSDDEDDSDDSDDDDWD